MATLTSLFDACVLYPAALRDVLMSMSRADLFAARWTDAIHEEWMGSLLQNHPELNRERLNRTRQLMNETVHDCLIKGYERLIDALVLPDPDDRHVLAAAIKGRVDVIVTYNLRDFPAEILDEYNIESQHPDDFIAGQFDLHAAAIIEVVRTHRERLRNPPKTAEQYIDTMRQLQLPQTALRLAECAQFI